MNVTGVAVHTGRRLSGRSGAGGGRRELLASSLSVTHVMSVAATGNTDPSAVSAALTSQVPLRALDRETPQRSLAPKLARWGAKARAKRRHPKGPLRNKGRS